MTLQTASGGGALSADTNKDVGLAMQYHNGSVAKTAFVGFDDSAGKLTFVPDATISSEVVSGTKGTIVANLEGAVTGDVTGNADTATALETARTIGGVSFDGSANINLPGVNTSGTQDTSGNATTATALATGRTIGMTGDVSWTSASFTGSGNVTGTSTIQTDAIETAMIEDDAVTYAKIQNVSTTDRILGRDSAGAGVIEEITPTNLRTMLNVADGANAYTHPNHSGDVTSSADGAQTIANDAVTFAKMQNVAANSLLVRNAASSGDLSELAVADTKIIIGDGTGFGAFALSGDVTMTNGGAVTIANDAVEQAMIADDAVGADQLASNAVVNASVASGAAIAFSKMENLTASKVLVSDGNGDVSASAVTSTELGILDGGTSATSTTLVDADRVVVNDADVGMKQVAMSDVKTYIDVDGGSLINAIIFG